MIFLKLSGRTNELVNLSKIPNNVGLDLQFMGGFDFDSLKEVNLLLKKKNLLKVTIPISCSITNDIEELFSIQTITSLHIGFWYVDLEIPKLKSLSKLENLKYLTIENYERFIKYELSSFEFDELCHLEIIKLIRLKIDDSFNQIFSKSNLKKIYLNECIFINDFEFNLNLNNLRKMRFINTDLPLKSLYESIKRNTERISFFYYFENEDINYFDGLISILTFMKFEKLKLIISEKVYDSILDINSNIDIKNLYLSVQSIENVNLSNFICKLNNLESIKIINNISTKETFENLKNQKNLKRVTLLFYNLFLVDNLFELLNFLKIENLSIMKPYYKLHSDLNNFTKLFILLKDNQYIKSFNTDFWNDSIFDMISHNNTLEKLEISLFKINEETISKFLKILKENTLIKELTLNSCDFTNPIYDYLRSNPKITYFKLQTHFMNYSILESLKFNTNLKYLIINYNDNIIDNIIIDNIFRFNYTLIDLKISKFYLCELEIYLKRNREIFKLFKFNREYDVHFNFL